jgi:hypothetical protein
MERQHWPASGEIGRHKFRKNKSYWWPAGEIGKHIGTTDIESAYISNDIMNCG